MPRKTVRKPRRSTRNPQPETLSAFIRQHGITATSKYLGQKTEGMGSKSWPHHAYTVTLRMGRKSMSVPFRMGTGLHSEPTAMDVMSSLVLDAAGFEDSKPRSGGEDAHIESFASEYGYESIGETLRVYRAVKKMSAALKRFLGPAGFATAISLEVDD